MSAFPQLPKALLALGLALVMSGCPSDFHDFAEDAGDDALAEASGSGGQVDARASDAGNVDATTMDSPEDSPEASLTDAPPLDSSLMGDGGCAGLACDGGCVSANDLHNCGACGNDCTSLPNVSGTQLGCTGGKCVYSCASGYADCADAGNGCPNSLSQNGNCGSCGVTCQAPTPVCSGSACSSNCSGATPDLCGVTCTNKQSDPMNCGACGMACSTSVAHASPTCSGGACGYQCNTSLGYSPCSGGCTNFSSDDANCGGCGMSCGTQHCVNGSCHVCVPGNTQPCGHAAVGICHPGTQTCQPDGSWGACSGDQEPLPRDCTSSADNDCDGKPDNTIDSVCQCAIGTSTPCGTHPQDGVGACHAGSAQCVAGPGNSSSSVGACSGSVGPGTDTCNVPSGDLDCDGIQGDGPGCFTTYWVFYSNPPTNSWVCPTTPKDMQMATSSTPPAGYSFLTTIKLPSATNPNAVPIYSCMPTSGHAFASGGNCGLMEGSTFLGNGSTTNGGNGWVAIDYQNAAANGTVGLLLAGDSHCCNCTGVTTFTNPMPMYTVPSAP